MGRLQPPPGVQGPTLDVQVLEGLETYIATEQFLHQLEAASAEWIDLSEHKRSADCHKRSSLELTQVDSSSQAAAPQASSSGTTAASHPEPSARQQQQASSSSGSSTGFLRRFSWSRSASSGGTSTRTSQNPSSDSHQSSETRAGGAAAAEQGIAAAGDAAGVGADGPAAAAGAGAGSVFELLEQQPPLHQDVALQEPFVLVSADDAIDAMAYYIALYLSRAPEARYMEPKQLQAALRQTFMAIRRQRYRVIWDWGRWMYRCTAVSYSALQLYEHPWLVRAVVAAVWTSSKMALGFLW